MGRNPVETGENPLEQVYLNRRQFLIGLGASAVGLGLGACGLGSRESGAKSGTLANNVNSGNSNTDRKPGVLTVPENVSTETNKIMTSLIENFRARTPGGNEWHDKVGFPIIYLYDSAANDQLAGFSGFVPIDGSPHGGVYICPITEAYRVAGYLQEYEQRPNAVPVNPQYRDDFIAAADNNSFWTDQGHYARTGPAVAGSLPSENRKMPGPVLQQYMPPRTFFSDDGSKFVVKGSVGIVLVTGINPNYTVGVDEGAYAQDTWQCVVVKGEGSWIEDYACFHRVFPKSQSSRVRE